MNQYDSEDHGQLKYLYSFYIDTSRHYGYHGNTVTIVTTKIP